MRDLCNYVVSLFLTSALVSFPPGCRRGASDEAIAKDIQGKISADPDTKDSQVSVAAKDGKVTLSGSVNSQAAQQKIEQITREESGARVVDDQTTILPIVIPVGTVLVVTTSQALSSKTSQAGRANSPSPFIVESLIKAHWTTESVDF